MSVQTESHEAVTWNESFLWWLGQETGYWGGKKKKKKRQERKEKDNCH